MCDALCNPFALVSYAIASKYGECCGGDTFDAPECLRSSCCCSCLWGWPCCPNPNGFVAVAFDSRLPTPPVYILRGGPKRMTIEEYDKLVREGGSEKPMPEVAGPYRPFDGGGNNPDRPWLGQGGRPYGLTFISKQPENLPPAEDVVRKLFRRIKFEPAPNNTNSLAPWIATWAIHDFFRSDSGRGGGSRPHVNLHSSYLDLSPVYGYSEERNAPGRTGEGGKLKPDWYSEDRFKGLPMPRAIAVLFSREHNHICDMLAQKYPDRFKTDQELFDQARLINIGVYISCISRDYVGCIIKYAPGGQGNALVDAARGPKTYSKAKAKGFHTSMEFNVMYRFHATIPETYDPATAAQVPDSDIEATLADVLATPSGRWGPSHFPFVSGEGGSKYADILGQSEIKAIELTRELGMTSYNDFRRKIGYKPFKKFTDFAPDHPEIGAELERMYGEVENVEGYVGMIVEQGGKTGWGPPAAMAFAIVGDAIASIQNDKYHTDLFTAEVYTEWGYEHAMTNSLANLISRHTSIKLEKTADLAKVTGSGGAGKGQVAPAPQEGMHR